MIELLYREEFEKNKDGVMERYYVIVAPLYPSLGDHSSPDGGWRGRDQKKTINRAMADILEHIANGLRKVGVIHESQRNLFSLRVAS